MQEKMNNPMADDFRKVFESSKNAEESTQIKQGLIASVLLDPLSATVSLPKVMDEKLAVFRTPTISQCIVCNSIEDIIKE